VKAVQPRSGTDPYSGSISLLSSSPFFFPLFLPPSPCSIFFYRAGKKTLAENDTEAVDKVLQQHNHGRFGARRRRIFLSLPPFPIFFFLHCVSRRGSASWGVVDALNDTTDAMGLRRTECSSAHWRCWRPFFFPFFPFFFFPPPRSLRSTRRRVDKHDKGIADLLGTVL